MGAHRKAVSKVRAVRRSRAVRNAEVTAGVLGADRSGRIEDARLRGTRDGEWTGRATTCTGDPRDDTSSV